VILLEDLIEFSGMDRIPGLGEFACGVLRTQIVLRWHLMGGHLIGMHLVGVDLCVYLIGIGLIGHKAD
jgi:hypothetical protein